MDSIFLYFHVYQNEIFYVGIGDKYRPYSAYHRNKWWHNIVNKYEYSVIIIQECLTYKDACELETKYIKQIGRADLGLGSLVNLTDGGEGFTGPKSEMHKKKIGVANKKSQIGNKNGCGNKGNTPWISGKNHSTKSKKQISEKLQGQTWTKSRLEKVLLNNEFKLGQRNSSICEMFNSGIKISDISKNVGLSNAMIGHILKINNK